MFFSSGIKEEEFFQQTMLKNEKVLNANYLSAGDWALPSAIITSLVDHLCFYHIHGGSRREPIENRPFE